MPAKSWKETKGIKVRMNFFISHFARKMLINKKLYAIMN